MHRLIKLNFVFLAVALLVSPLALSAQSTSSAKWSGVHVGVIGGVAAGNYNVHGTDGTDTLDYNSALAGGRVGVQGGVDFNFKGLVVGAVADWSWADARMKLDVAESGNNISVLDGKVKQMTTVRARVGKSYHHVLPYVHGGLLVADTQLGSGVISFNGSNASVSKVHSGFVVGGGFEYALARHYSLSTEYGYNHVSGADVTNALGIGGTGAVATLNPHFSTLTVGFNYRF